MVKSKDVRNAEVGSVPSPNFSNLSVFKGACQRAGVTGITLPLQRTCRNVEILNFITIFITLGASMKKLNCSDLEPILSNIANQNIDGLENIYIIFIHKCYSFLSNQSTIGFAPVICGSSETKKS